MGMMQDPSERPTRPYIRSFDHGSCYHQGSGLLGLTKDGYMVLA